jgi:hypothetical protein
MDARGNNVEGKKGEAQTGRFLWKNGSAVLPAAA